jgi:hypothetical protein
MTFSGVVAANNLSDVVDREKAWDNLGANISANVPIPSPSLDLSFAANKSLVDNISGNNLIAFSRASTGTFIGSNGLLQTAASGVPRFDHNPTTGESLGLLVEEARTNTIAYSQAFDNGSVWLTYAGLSHLGNTAAAPDGSITADTSVEGGGSGYHVTGVGIGTSGNTTYTASCHAKPLGRTWFGINIIQNTFSYATSGFQLIGDGGAYVVSVRSGTFTNVSASIQKLSNGWYRCIMTFTTDANTGGTNAIRIGPSDGYPVGITSDGGWGYQGTLNLQALYLWGVQLEQGAFPTSYIPTVASTVTRTPDLVQIAGTNLSSFYNAGRGTIYAEQFRQTGTGAVVSGDTASNRLLEWQSSRIYRTSWAGVNYVWTGAPAVSNTSLNRAALAYGATAQGAVNGTSYALSPIIPVASFSTTSLNFQGAFSRILFWDDQLPSSAIAAITNISSVQIGALPSSYSTNATTLGKDIAALNGVRNVSTRDFVFIKGLISAVQPRLSTAAQQVASGTVFQDAAMLKASPTTIGNYFFSSGITLSGVSTRINGTPALSIATSPFSGSTATASILLRELQPQVNWRITEPMPSGTIASPEFAIPFETNDFVLFMKAGQN